MPSRPVVIGFLSQEGGAIAVFAALVLAAVTGFSALALDTGLAYNQKRQLQSATDLAAMAAAAASPGRATAAAVSSAVANGFTAADVSLVESGTYSADSSVSASLRFTPATSGTGNAVRVTMRKTHHYMFSTVLGLLGAAPSDPAVSTRSIASTRALAAFSLGSGLASLNGGIANSLLSALTGSSVSLSLMDYQNLAAANVDLLTFSRNLATRLNLQAGTYSALGGATVSLPRAVAALVDTVSGTAAAAPAMALLAAVQSSTATLNLGSLINYGPDGGLTVGNAGPVAAKVDALTLVSALLQVANGQHQVSTSLNASLPGILSASLDMTIGEPASASLLTIGPVGTQLTTAQTRLKLSLQLAGPSFAPVLQLPLTLQLAPATAILSSIACTGGSAAASSVGVAATPGLAEAWVGTAAGQSLATFSTPLTSAATPIVSTPLLTIMAQGHATVANTQATTLTFSASDIASRTPQSTSTTAFVSPLLTSLFSSLQFNVTALGFLDLGTVNTRLFSILGADVAPIDTLVSSLLQTLGLSLGKATVWVSDAQCGRPVLVR